MDTHRRAQGWAVVALLALGLAWAMVATRHRYFELGGKLPMRENVLTGTIERFTGSAWEAQKAP